MLFKLPVPPSVNNAFVNVQKRGRVRSKQYQDWLLEADKWYYLQGLHKLGTIEGPRELHIRLPKIKGDASNRIKLVEDWLVSRRLTGDDRYNSWVSVKIDPAGVPWFCWITVTALEVNSGDSQPVPG